MKDLKIGYIILLIMALGGCLIFTCSDNRILSGIGLFFALQYTTLLYKG